MSRIEAIREPSEIEETGKVIGVEISDLMEKLEKHFNDSNTEEARTILNRLRYLERVKEIIEGKIAKK
jgi:uncharacterized protein YuzE